MQLPLLLARLVPVALIGALIPVAWANGAARLDAAYGTGARLSVRTPGLGPLLAASEREAKGGRPQRAIALAARAVTKAPIDAAAVRTLAIRSLEAGQSSRGEGLLRAAGGLGWYDVPTQLMWSDIAYSAGDLAVAVQRLDAAMRVTRGREAIVANRMRRIEQTEGGIDLIAARLATADDWRKPYLNDMGPLPASALDARVTMLRRLHANRVPLDRQESLPIQSQLIGRLRIDLARQVWQLTEQHSATRGTPVVVNDPDLLGVVTHGDRSPFEWTFPGSAGVYIDTAMAPAPLGRKVAHLRANSPIRIAFAEQMIALPPGAHMLTASITGAKTQSPLALELECWPQKTLVEGGTGELAQGTVHLSARVPQDCTYQKLRLLISGPEARNQADLFIGGVTFGS